ncbi:GIY-YIG catalytic domain protein [compost metagenome]
MPNYIYALHCPIADTVRYIGKSINPEKRLAGHISSARTMAYRHHTSAWIRKLLSVGLAPELLVIDEVPEGESWQDCERSWIAKAPSLGWRLTNSTAGGEGLDYICPEAARAYKENHSLAMRAYWSAPESRKKASERWKQVWAVPEVREKRAASMLSYFSEPDNRIKAAEVLNEIRNRPEVRVKMSESAKARHPESKLLEAIKSPEFSREQADRLKDRWKDPAGREKLKAARWTEEAKLAKAADILSRKDKMKASITPEVLARRNASIKASWDRRRAEKAAKLAATTPAPYTEST